jgi:hypothetical protein
VYSVVEPVNWLEENLLGRYQYNHTTPDWVTVLYLFCGRACELGGGESGWAGTGTITPRQTGLRLYPYSVVEPVNWVEEKLLGGYNNTTPGWTMYWHNLYNTVSTYMYNII